MIFNNNFSKKTIFTAIFFPFAIIMLLITISFASASQILVTDSNNNQLMLIDTELDSPKILEVPDGPSKLVISNDKKTAVTSLKKGNAIAIINLEEWKLDKIITVGRKPIDLILINNKVYAANSNGEEIAVIDLEKGEVVKNIAVSKGTSSLSKFISEGKEKIVALSRNSQKVSVIDAESYVVESVIELPSEIKDGVLIASSEDGLKLFIADDKSETLFQLDSESNYSISHRYQIGSVSEYNQMITGNRYLIVSSNIISKGEINIINSDDQSIFSIPLSQASLGLAIEKGVIYAANGKFITMINRETNIEKDFEAGSPNGVAVLREDYVPLGDVQVTEKYEGSDTIKDDEPQFPWKRIIILVLILAIIMIFLRSKRSEEKEKIDEKTEKSAEKADAKSHDQKSDNNSAGEKGDAKKVVSEEEATESTAEKEEKENKETLEEESKKAKEKEIKKESKEKKPKAKKKEAKKESKRKEKAKAKPAGEKVKEKSQD